MSEFESKKDPGRKNFIFRNRKASKEENQVLIERIDSLSEAAKLRNILSDKSPESFHDPIEFSWQAFWKTFIYENLPPVFLSPLAALILEGSPSRAWHVSQNRNLIALSTQHMPLPNIIVSWVITYPASWLLTSALIMAVFFDSDLLRNIDTFQIILAYSCLFTRRLIICAKYGFYRPDELERLCHPAPRWSSDKTERKFIGRGWNSPKDYPGLIEDEMTSAMDENDIALHAIPLEFDQDTISKMSEENGSEIFTSDTTSTKSNETSSAFFLFNLINSVYEKDFVKPYRLILYPSMLAIIFTPFIVKSISGIYLFGSNSLEVFITTMSVFGFLICFQLFFFGLICAIDFDRRIESTKKLGDIIKFPGLPYSSIFPSSKNSEESKYIFLDLRKRKNVFAWMSLRNVLRSFGETYLYRIESYTSILVFFSLFCVIILNLIAWTEIRHHISTIYIIGVIILTISGISLYAIFKAIKLQSLSQIHRDYVRNEIFIIEEEISELEEEGNLEKIKELQSSKNLLQQADQNINYKEFIFKPTTIMGYSANSGVIGSVLGVVITGCLFAIQGFVSTGIEYDSFGWFLF